MLFQLDTFCGENSLAYYSFLVDSSTLVGRRNIDRAIEVLYMKSGNPNTDFFFGGYIAFPSIFNFISVWITSSTLLFHFNTHELPNSLELI